MRKGALEYATRAGAFVMRAGGGCLINAGVLHRCGALGGMGGVEYTVQQFGRAAIAGADSVQRRYVAPLAACGALEALPLAPGCAAIAAMEEAFHAAEAEPEGFEMAVCAAILRAWLALWPLAKPLLEREGAPDRPESARVKQMLVFMRDHYFEDIRLADVAAAAGVCVRECLRCFRQELGMTPLSCLTQLRVRRAAQLLRETARPVTDIALSCGCSSPSYFGKVFRRQMGVSPGDYRRA